MDNNKIELLERFLDDSISAEEAKQFLAWLESDESARREFAAALRMKGLLHAGFDRDADCERLAEVVGLAIRSGDRPFDSRVMAGIRSRQLTVFPRKRKWIRIAEVAAAVFIVAVAAFVVFTRRVAPDLRVAAVGPDTIVERGTERIPAVPGLELAQGDGLLVPLTGWASLRYADGTGVEIAPASSIVIGDGPGKSIRIMVGKVTADVAPQPSEEPMRLLSSHAEAKVLGTDLAFAVTPEGTQLLVRHGKVAFSKTSDSAMIEVRDGQAATAAPGRALVAEPIGGEILRKLGKNHFMLGIMSGLGETWISDAKAQGARFDLRYQHLSWNWTKWNSNGGFVPLYSQESDKLGAITVFSYYCMIQGSPGKDTGMGPAAAIAANAGNRETMKKYLSDLTLFMRKAGEHGKPLILHAEPEVWGHFLSAEEFRPNTPDKIRVIVGSTGLSDFEGLDDTLASFGKAFGILRDRYAPNVLLAWHASQRGDRSPQPVDEVLRSLGNWDLLFTDVGDRDAGFREAKGEKNAWWTEKEFADFRRWGSELHARTGLPLMIWRIPLGNTRMAACNNTPWHYMDNRAEHWMENYPANKNVADWAAAGFVGLLFGGGTMECTVHKDNAKDGVTNPPPVQGNKGESSAFPDDDGGYLRLRAGAYYKAGPLPLPGN